MICSASSVPYAERLTHKEVETVSNTITRNIMLHIIWKFNKKASKK